MGVQKRLVAAAPGYAGYLLEGDNGIFYHPIRNRRAVEEKKFVDKLEEARIAAAMEANPQREIVVWRPQYPVLIGDFRSLFDFLRENPSEKNPSLKVLLLLGIWLPFYRFMRMEILRCLLQSMEMLLWKKQMLKIMVLKLFLSRKIMV